MTKILTLCIQAELLSLVLPLDSIDALEAKRIIGTWERFGLFV